MNRVFVPIVLIILIWASAVAGCGGSQPASSPTGTSASLGAGVAAVSGRLLETLSRSPVSGALIESSASSVRTDASGNFQLPASAVVIPVTVTASRHVTRKSILGSASLAPTLDVIETDSPWNLDFYRELARDGARRTSPNGTCSTRGSSMRGLREIPTSTTIRRGSSPELRLFVGTGSRAPFRSAS